jgi:hypothetical protein
LCARISGRDSLENELSYTSNNQDYGGKEQNPGRKKQRAGTLD